MRKLINLASESPWVSSLGATVIFFVAVLTGFTPLLNSDDDAFLMYSLAGGYGETPTNLLHYNHIWHPALGWTVKSLFSVMPAVNWYTIVLLLFHFTGCVLIMQNFRVGVGVRPGIFLGVLFFIYFESRLLLSPTFTGAAFVAATGALFYLNICVKEGKWKTVIFPAIVLLLAGMLRLHIVWLAILLFVPFNFFLLDRKYFVRWMIVCGSIVILLFLLNKHHESYYREHIPGWEKQEAFRQAMFYAYNRPVKADPTPVFKDSAEMQLYFAGFLYDTLSFTSERLQTIGHNITRQRWLNTSEDRQGLYWLFMELRVYLLLFAVFIGCTLWQKKFLLGKRWLISLLTVVMIYAGLFVFLKVTFPVHVGLLMVLWLHFAGQYKSDEPVLPQKGWPGFTAGLLLLLAFSWMGQRVVSEDKTNEQKKEKFYCAMEELNQDSSKLFIATDDAFPLSYFYIWDLPRDFPVHNLLYKDRILSGMYTHTLKKYGIGAVDSSIVNNEHVYFLGKPLLALEKIWKAGYSGRFPAYKCLEVRKLLSK